MLDNGADINIKDKEYYTSLIYASKYGHTKITEILIANKADVNARIKGSYTSL